VPNLADPLFRRAVDRAAHVALVFGERRWNYADLAREAAAMAGDLGALGIGPGTRVGLMVTARPDFIILQQALFALGATVVPLNILYRPGEVAQVAESCALHWLLLDATLQDRLPARDALPTLQGVLLVEASGAAMPEGDGWLRPLGTLRRRASAIAAPRDLPDHAIGLMLNTSATTGRAKGVMLSIANIRGNYDPTPGWLGIDAATVTLCALPLYNTFALNQCINATMVTGCTLVLLPRFDAEACLGAIAAHRCTFFPAVPTMLQKLIDHPAAARHDLTSITRIMTGGAPVPAALLERLQAAMGRDVRVMTGYGLTEATAIVSLEHVELRHGRVARPKSIGRVLPGIAWRILREDGAEAAPGEVGEICVRGPGVMQGYFNQPGETAKAVQDGWLHTGDLGTIDADGYGTIVDRKKDLIIRGGQNIYPADIEEAIYRIPGVREVAVIAAPDDLLGEVPVAYVAADPSLTAEAVIAHCRAELAVFKLPAAVHFLPELPKGPTGKILRRGLRAGTPALESTR
jgi:long-chain acyl-CoA synthetase